MTIKCPVCGEAFSNAKAKGAHLRQHDEKEKERIIVKSIENISGDDPATIDELTSYLDVSNSFVYNTFECYDDAIERANYKKQGRGPRDGYKISEEELLREIKELREDLGHVPSTTEMDSCGEYNSGTYENRFGGFTNAVEKAGLEPRGSGGELTGPEHPNYKGGKIPTGPNWNSVREKVLQRDEYKCRICGDKSNIVHHILPRREVFEQVGYEYESDLWEYCNSKDNLVTLCKDCHRSVEGRWKEMDHKEFCESASKELSEGV